MSMRLLVSAAVVAVALLSPSLSRAEETSKPITIHGRAAKPSVVIEIERARPNIGLRPLTPPKSFFSPERK